MSDDRSTVTISRWGYVAIVDAVQCAVIDKRASKATRKAAFSALLALVDAGLVIGDMSISLPPSDGKGPAPAHGQRLTG